MGVKVVRVFAVGGVGVKGLVGGGEVAGFLEVGEELVPCIALVADFICPFL